MEYRIVMIGPHGERDYVDRIFDGSDGFPKGMPCVGGCDPKYAGVFPETCANNIVKNLRKNWMNPHIAVEMETVAPNVEGEPGLAVDAWYWIALPAAPDVPPNI